MPGGSLSGSYTSLENVYRGTTLPNNAGSGTNVIKSMKKALSFGGAARKKLEPLLDKNNSDMMEVLTRQPLVAGQTDSHPIAMPTTMAEEAALLGTIPSDSMDDIELKSVQLQLGGGRRLSGDGGYVEQRVRTDRGDLLVAVRGDHDKPAILTYHDLGLNYVSSFQAFCNYEEMRALLEHFCVYHVTAPGQEEGAPTLPDDYVYPTMDELANQLNYVLGHFGIQSFVGLGVGAGANILARFAIAHPTKVEALVLVNCTSTAAGWLEWGYQKMNARQLRSRGVTQPVLDYLLWHHFGRNTEECNPDLVSMYRTHFALRVNPVNLARLTDAYVRRTDLGLTRAGGATWRVPVLNLTGARSPHADDTVVLNGRLPPTCCTWMKISDCGMVLEEQPGKVAEAFRLFLQGEGIVTRVSGAGRGDERVVARGRERRRACGHSPVIRITENPISEAVVC